MRNNNIAQVKIHDSTTYTEEYYPISIKEDITIILFRKKLLQWIITKII